MQMYIIVFFTITLIKLSHQAQINCTSFGPTIPYATDLRKMAFEVEKVQKKYSVPILADYSDSNCEEDMREDLTRYTEGINNEDARLTISQLVNKYGYDFEQHNVRTSDGYILTHHRIPNNGNKVVFLNHGIFGSSLDWLLAGKDSLPFILASLGYDVWLGNFRGNRYSYKHESLTSDCAQFWDFSWDDFGYYDLPASIDYITYKTGQKKLTYIGYSMGTTAFFVLTSLLPEYNDNIFEMVALSPMAWMANAESPIMKLLADNEDLERKFKTGLGAYEFTPSDLLTESMRRVLCGNNAVSQVLCSQMAFLITGFNRKLLNMNNFYAISQHYPAGSSIKTLVHYSQNVVSGQFRRYDNLDVGKNIDEYDFMNPPEYPVENIRAKVSFIVSHNDCLSNVTDVEKLLGKLPNVGKVVYLDDYSSVDYLWAYDVKEKVYETILALIQ